VLAEALPDGDVVIAQDRALRGGNFSYIHKVRDGKCIYFVANSSDAEVDTWVALRGKLTPEIWNPHDGKISPARAEHIIGKEGPVTRVQVKLAPVHSLFLVAVDTELMNFPKE
jgi:hypothetical protein